jgi:hypothetical protein
MPSDQAFLQAIREGPHARQTCLVYGSVHRQVRVLLRQRLGLRFAPSGPKEPRVITVGSFGDIPGEVG